MNSKNKLKLDSGKITEFQKKVFNEVSKIPEGRTTSYKKIAEKLNTSPRAVAKALSNNPFPIQIPCHRVIRSNGKFKDLCFSLLELKL